MDFFEKQIAQTKQEYDEIVNSQAGEDYWGCDEAKKKCIEHLLLYVRHHFNKHDAEFIKIEISDKYQQ